MQTYSAALHLCKDSEQAAIASQGPVYSEQPKGRCFAAALHLCKDLCKDLCKYFCEVWFGKL
jgi:hypothetical protein